MVRAAPRLHSPEFDDGFVKGGEITLEGVVVGIRDLLTKNPLLTVDDVIVYVESLIPAIQAVVDFGNALIDSGMTKELAEALGEDRFKDLLASIITKLGREGA